MRKTYIVAIFQCQSQWFVAQHSARIKFVRGLSEVDFRSILNQKLCYIKISENPNGLLSNHTPYRCKRLYVFSICVTKCAVCKTESSNATDTLWELMKCKHLFGRL